MRVRTFGDLLNGHETAEISCLYTGKLVRKLSRDGSGNIVLDPMEGPTLEVPASCPIQYEPWFMDRGSLLFEHEYDQGRPLKLCGEGDPIRFEDGTEDSVNPDPACPIHPH